MRESSRNGNEMVKKMTKGTLHEVLEVIGRVIDQYREGCITPMAAIIKIAGCLGIYG